jgi:ligand-binding sensor domain-containing protein
MQDREGDIWISGFSGMLTFNPRAREFKKYPLVGDADLIYEDPVGRMWFYTTVGEVVVYDRKTGSLRSDKIWEHIPSPYGRYEGRTEARARGMFQDRRGRMVLAVDGGLLMLSQADNKWSFAAVKELGIEPTGMSNGIRGATVDRSGRIWLITLNGIAVLGQ